MKRIEPNLKTLFDEFAVANFRGHTTRAAELLREIRNIWITRLTPAPEVPDIICIGLDVEAEEDSPLARCIGKWYRLQSDVNGTRRYVPVEDWDRNAVVIQRLTPKQRLDRQLEAQQMIGGFISIMERYGGESAYHEYLNSEPDYQLEQQLDVLTAAHEHDI